MYVIPSVFGVYITTMFSIWHVYARAYCTVLTVDISTACCFIIVANYVIKCNKPETRKLELCKHRTI